MFHVLILNGPNLNLLGTREPEHYGAVTLDEITAGLQKQAEAMGVQLTEFQSNAEHELVGRVQDAPSNGVDFIIINPAALTHTSVGLRDALSAVGFRLLKSTFPIFMQGKNFARSLFSPILPWV